MRQVISRSIDHHNKTLIIISCVILIILSSIMIPARVFAAQSTRILEVANLTETGTYLFSIGWDQGQLTAVLIAPNGTRIPQESPVAGVAVASREKIIIFKVEDAAPGIWKIEFADDNNGRVGVVVQRLIKPLQVEEITAVQTAGDTIKAQFRLVGENNVQCQYEAYLSLDGQLANSRMIGQGQATTGQLVDQDFKLTGIGSYSQYYLLIRAECSQNGFTDFDMEASAAFSYSNPAAPLAVNSLKVISLPLGIEVSWEKPSESQPENYTISAFGSDALPYHSVTVGADTLAAVIPADESDKIRIMVTAQAKGLTGTASVIEIDRKVTLEGLLGCTLPDNDDLSSGSVDIAYSVSDLDTVNTAVMINDNRFVQELSGDGLLHLELGQGTNNVRIIAKIDAVHAVADIHSWTADTISPMLRIYDDPDGLETSLETWTISGNADRAEQVLVNGKKVEADHFSNFKAVVELKIGQNFIEVTGSDLAGNKAVYEGRITRIGGKAESVWYLSAWFIIAFVLMILTVSLFVVAWRLKRLNTLIAVILSASLLFSLVSAAIGTCQFISARKVSGGILSDEIQARASLEQGLGVRAFKLAVSAFRKSPGDPELLLLCARASLISGDLPAADHYYQQIGQLNQVQQDQLINAEQALIEYNAWKKAVNLESEPQSQSLDDLSADVLDHCKTDNQQINTVDQAARQIQQLVQAEIDLDHLLAADPTSENVDWAELEGNLQALADSTVSQEASDLLAESLSAREDWVGLLEDFPGQGSAGLISLADMILAGCIPQEAALAIHENMSAEAAWQLIYEDLVAELIRAAHKNRADFVRLYTLAAQLLHSSVLNNQSQAAELLQKALALYDPGTGVSDPWTDRLLLQLIYALADQGIESPGDVASLSELLDELPQETTSEATDPTKPTGTTGETTSETTPETDELPDGLNGTTIRDDLQPLFNISAPEMTETGRIRLTVTLAAASQGFPGGVPTADDFELRSNIGFRRLLTVNSMTEVTNVPRYTMLLIDCRPFIPADTLALERQAALAYVRSKPIDEKVIVVCGGLPEQYIRSICSDGLQELFGNPEMECYLPTSDLAMLEEYIMTPYPGDSFSSPDLFQMIYYPLSRMTSIDPRGSTGTWETAPLSAMQPWFGQVIVFTNGDPDGGVSAGGDKTIEFVRGSAIVSNTAIHIVGINPVVPGSELQALAEAGRGDYIVPASDDLLAFYAFIRTRPVKMFIADCLFPENPQLDFTDIMARHIPTGVVAGFRRNPGLGVDLIGNPQYSDAGLGEAEFSDYTGDFTDPGDPSDGGEPYNPGLNPGGDPFADPGDDENQDPDSSLTDAQEGSIAVFGPDRHTIARGVSGLVLITLSGQGFSGLQPANVNITIPGQGRIATAYIDITSNTAIRFFLPASLAAGQYSLQVAIGDLTFLFTDTFLVYDVNGVTTLTFGEWTITAGGMQRASDNSGLWDLSLARINDLIRFSDKIKITGSWMDGSSDELTVTPESGAYVSFDPESDSLFVQEFFIEESTCLQFGTWHPFTLTRDGDGVAVSSREWQDIPARPITLGLFDFPYDTGTLFPDRVEVPVLELNLDLPLMEFLLMRAGIAEFAASASSMFTIKADDLDLQLEAEISSDVAGCKLFSALKIKGVELEIDTAVSRVAIGLEAELVPDKNIRAAIALKGAVLDELSVSIDVEIPLTTTPPSPIPVSLTELGGGVENLADAFTGSLSGLLGITVVGTAKFEAGNVVDIMPFVKTLPWLPADKVPPILATDNTELRFRPWPFSLAFATDVKLFDAFQIGRAELSLGYYAFNQSLLNLSDDEAVGLHALLAVGPDIDLKVVRVGYSAGPSLDINNHGVFIQATGGAWVGINLGIIELTADMTGKFLIAVHDAEDSSYPQLSIVANAAPSVGIPGLWSAGETLDVRLLISENGVRLVGIPSPIDQALAWLDDQITSAASETWDAVTSGIDLIDEAAGEAWNVITDTGSAIVGTTTDVVVDVVSDGVGILLDTGGDAVDAVDNYTGGALSNMASTGGQVVGSISSGISGFFSGH